MKAVVLEIRDKKAAVLTKNGEVKLVRNRNYDIGKEIEIDNVYVTNRFASLRRFSAVAALLILVLGSGTYAYASPYGTISLDVNPSIEYTINRFERVIKVSGLNDDGTNILNESSSKNLLFKKIDDALDVTVDTLISDGYIKSDETNYVVLSTHTGNDKFSDKVIEKLEKRINENEDLEPISFKISDEEYKEAKEMGISPGKMKITRDLEEAFPEDIDAKDWNDRSINDIMQEFNKAPLDNQAPPEPDEKPDDSTNAQPIEDQFGNSEPSNHSEGQPESPAFENPSEGQPDNPALENHTDTQPENPAPAIPSDNQNGTPAPANPPDGQQGTQAPENPSNGQQGSQAPENPSNGQQGTPPEGTPSGEPPRQ